MFDDQLPERWNKEETSLSKISETIFKKNGTPANLKKLNPVDIKVIEGVDTSGIQAGMEVEHARFGIGKVLIVEGNAGDIKATVFFQGFGNKHLLLKFAKLRIVG